MTDTHLDPTLLFHLEGVILGLGTIDGDPLARRGQVVGAADGRPLPVLHLGERGWTGRRRGGGRERHQKSRSTGQQRGREAQEKRRIGRGSAVKPSPVASLGVRAIIKRWRGEGVL